MLKAKASLTPQRAIGQGGRYAGGDRQRVSCGQYSTFLCGRHFRADQAKQLVDQ
jgi:hypothetical protein